MIEPGRLIRPMMIRKESRSRPGWSLFAALILSLNILALVTPRTYAQGEIGTGISVSGGILGLDNTEIPYMFTWSSGGGGSIGPRISGFGWPAGGTVTIHMVGPLNQPGVASRDLVLGAMIADSSGNLVPGFSGLFIPFVDFSLSPPGNIRPGNYGIYGFCPPPTTFQAPITALASDRINIAPMTNPRFQHNNFLGIDWAFDRGARKGILGEEYSPELSDPEWLSVWDEQPVAIYGTAAEVFENGVPDRDGGNQPVHISHHDIMWTHYAHDLNVMIVPDRDYQWVIGDANIYAFNEPETVSSGRIEMEWETQNNGTPFTYGQGNIGIPLWATPTAGDRIFAVGRWAMDNGHPSVGLRTEIHPARMLATMRKRFTAVPLPGTSVLTRASQVDIYLSGHGGGANRFPDGLSQALNNGGAGGGLIANALSANALNIYESAGPADLGTIGSIADVVTSILSFFGVDTPNFDLIRPIAGPSGLGWGIGPEERPINDMDYDFDVPLPPRPAGATQVLVRQDTHGFLNAYLPVITYTNPSVGFPTTAHIHLPASSFASRIFADTLVFFWDTFSPPGEHFSVQMAGITPVNPFFNTAIVTTVNPPTWNMWADVCGKWFFLNSLNSSGFSHLQWGTAVTGLGQAQQDVFLDPQDTLRVYTLAYEPHDFENQFGVNVGKPAYQAGLDAANAEAFGSGDNADLSGAVFRMPAPSLDYSNQPISYPTPSTPIEYTFFVSTGAGISRVPAKASLYSMSIMATHINSPPHVQFGGDSMDFGKPCFGSSVDRVYSLSNSGQDPLAVSGMTVAGGGYSIVMGPASPFSIPGSGSISVRVRFKPTDVTQGAGTLTINTNDPLHPPTSFALAGSVGFALSSVTAATTRTPTLVIGTATTWQVTIVNQGSCTLTLKPSITGTGFSMVLPSSYINPLTGGLLKDIMVPPGGTNTDLTVKFVCPSTNTKFVGTLALAGNDPLHPVTTLTFGAEGVPVGMRVLVVNADGTPCPIVDDIQLKNSKTKVNAHLRDVALTNIEPPASWKPILYHYMTALPPTGPGDVYELRVQVGNKKQTLNFALSSDEFRQIVIALP